MESRSRWNSRRRHGFRKSHPIFYKSLIVETVQVIAFLTAVFGKKGTSTDKKRMRLARERNLPYPRILIICPGSVMSNWERELHTVPPLPPESPENILTSKWGWWHVSLYHGTNKSVTLNTASSGRLEILITTYTTYKQNERRINMIEWDCVIADECHIIKERTSEVTEKMALINSRVRIGLTGTAIQNNYEVQIPFPQFMWEKLMKGTVDVVGLDQSRSCGEFD